MHQSTVAWWLTLLALANAGKQHTSNHQRSSKRQQHVSSNDSGDVFRSPDLYGLRPGPPIDMPSLVESPNKMYDPRPQDIDTHTLRQTLGAHFDEKFTSIHRPLYFRNHSHIDYDYPFRKNRRGGLVPREPEALPDWLRQLRFRHIWLPDGSKARTSIGTTRLERKVQTFLWAHTSCPVIYKWRDLGRRFWPRWLKEGHCPPGKQSCSVPPGMMCQAARSEHKSLLRWHCKDWEKARGCHWLKVLYPVTTKCECQCPGSTPTTYP